jgi:energy-converting hydrogenase Eha subunit E
MHAFVVVCGILSVLIGGYVGIPYIRSILNGKTKPHQFTWLIFMIVNGTVALSQFIAGGRLSVLVYVLYFVYALVYFVLSLRYGVR